MVPDDLGRIEGLIGIAIYRMERAGEIERVKTLKRIYNCLYGRWSLYPLIASSKNLDNLVAYTFDK